MTGELGEMRVNVWDKNVKRIRLCRKIVNEEIKRDLVERKKKDFF